MLVYGLVATVHILATVLDITELGLGPMAMYLIPYLA